MTKSSHLDQKVSTSSRLRKATTGLLISALAAIALGGVVSPAQAETDGFTYTTTDSKVTITGYTGTVPTDLVIPATLGGNPVDTIGAEAFLSDQLTSVIISRFVTTIGNAAFQNNQLTSVIIPTSVTTIGSSAFNYNSLTSVTIGNSVTNIGAAAFQNSLLVSVTIPSSVTSIGTGAFGYNKLTSVTFEGNAPVAGGFVFDMNPLLAFVDVSAGSTGWDAEWSYVSVRVAESFTYTVDGYAVVTGCVATCPENLVIPETLGGYAVGMIGDSAFDSESLTSVTLPSSLTIIGAYAFDHNYLTSVSVPNSVTQIRQQAFASNSLTSFTIPPLVTNISDAMLDHNNLTSITIPSSVTNIGYRAFSYNQLTSVTIPSSVTSITRKAFFDNKLASVTIPESVIEIGISVFSYNLLTSVTIPSSVTSIGESAFSDNQLVSINFLGNAPLDGGYVFDDTLSFVDVPFGATGYGATWSGIPVRFASGPDVAKAPVYVSGAKISGSHKVKSKLTATAGTWTSTKAKTTTFAWYVCNVAVSTMSKTGKVASGCKAIAKATGNTYVIKAANKTKFIAAKITVKNTKGSSSVFTKTIGAIDTW